jgi:hypothetical protein
MDTSGVSGVGQTHVTVVVCPWAAFPSAAVAGRGAVLSSIIQSTNEFQKLKNQACILPAHKTDCKLESPVLLGSRSSRLCSAPV